MSSMGKKIDKTLNDLEKKRRIAQQVRGYRKRYSFVLNSSVENPPEPVSAAAVHAVWHKYGSINPKWAQYYWSINGIASPYYIPSDFWFTRVCKRMNSIDRFGWPLFQDKNYTDVIFSDVRQADIIVRNVSGQFLDHCFNLITAQQAAAICAMESDLIVKPSIDSKGGKSIEFISGQDAVLSVLQNRGEDFVVQRVLHQHEKMAALNPDSINSVRVMTLLWDGQVRVLGSLVRIGVKGCRIDNPHTSNGFSCVLTPEGKMVDKAFDRDWKPYHSLPNGFVVKDFEVPYYDRIVETVTRLHRRMPHFRIIGWDMTVSQDGEPTLIEANLDTPEIYFHQLGGGPIIQDPQLFEEIMCFVTGQ